jgi:NAD(P)-dependent dehydrogenase (short-subunit alcohol dehydrogenase family)
MARSVAIATGASSDIGRATALRFTLDFSVVGLVARSMEDGSFDPDRRRRSEGSLRFELTLGYSPHDIPTKRLICRADDRDYRRKGRIHAED